MTVLCSAPTYATICLPAQKNARKTTPQPVASPAMPKPPTAETASAIAVPALTAPLRARYMRLRDRLASAVGFATQTRHKECHRGRLKRRHRLDVGGIGTVLGRRQGLHGLGRLREVAGTCCLLASLPVRLEHQHQRHGRCERGAAVELPREWAGPSRPCVSTEELLRAGHVVEQAPKHHSRFPRRGGTLGWEML